MKQYKNLIKEQFGFVYLWRDAKHNKFYLGSHRGTLDDGYVGSNNHLKCAHSNRPETFRRRILEQHQLISAKDLLKKEEAWLQLIKPEELGVKYYNQKRVAAGGDIISDLSEEKRAAHRTKSIAARQEGIKTWRENNPEKLSEIGKIRRSKVKNHRGGSLPGDLNPSKRPEVREKLRITSTESAAKRKLNNVVHNAQTYKVTLNSGLVEYHIGTKSIIEKYCAEYPIKFGRFIGTGLPITSNRKKSKMNALFGATIEMIKK